MNDTLIGKYYKSSWTSRIFVERINNMMLLSDSSAIIKVTPDFKLFNDRSMFPELPGEGESFTYSKMSGCNNKTGFKITDLIKMLLKKDLKLVTLTPWILKDNLANYVRLGRIEANPILVDQRYLDWFEIEPESVFSENTFRKPVIFTDGGEPTQVQDIVMVIAQYDLKMDSSHKFPAVRDFNEGAIS